MPTFPFDMSPPADNLRAALLEPTHGDAFNKDEAGEPGKLANRCQESSQDVASAFKTSSAIAGVLGGFFVQFSAFAANLLVVDLYGLDPAELCQSERFLLLTSLLWSLLTSALVTAQLCLLRHLVASSFQAAGGPEGSEVEQDLVEHLETRFMMGSLVGLSLGWTVVDAMLGLSMQIGYSLLILVMALLWCRLLMACFARPKSSQDHPLLAA